MSHTCFRFSNYKNCNIGEIAVIVLITGIPATDVLVAKILFLYFNFENNNAKIAIILCTDFCFSTYKNCNTGELAVSMLEA